MLLSHGTRPPSRHQTKATPEVTVQVPPGCEHLSDGPTLTGPAAVVLCQLMGAHLPDIQVSACSA